MSKKKKLTLLKKILQRLNYDNRIDRSINKDLEIYDIDELIEVFESEAEEFNTIKVAFGVESLVSELLYIYYVIYNYTQNHIYSLETDMASIASFLVLTGLAVHIYADYEIQKANEKIYKLEKIEDDFED